MTKRKTNGCARFCLSRPFWFVCLPCSENDCMFDKKPEAVNLPWCRNIWCWWLMYHKGSLRPYGDSFLHFAACGCCLYLSISRIVGCPTLMLLSARGPWQNPGTITIVEYCELFVPFLVDFGASATKTAHPPVQCLVAGSCAHPRRAQQAARTACERTNLLD